MKNIILPYIALFIAAAIIALACAAAITRAATITTTVTGIQEVSRHNNVTKYYDYDNNTVCYVVWYGDGTGISCLKNI